MDYIANVENSEIDVSGIRTVLVQGDSSYPIIRFVLDPALTGLSWRVRGTYTDTNVAVLSPEITAVESGTEITLDWSVSSDFTTYDGDMQLVLVGANDTGTTVVKALAEITIQKDWSIGTTTTITLNLFEQLMAQANAAISKYPVITDGSWHVWNVTAEEYQDTGVAASSQWKSGTGITGTSTTPTAFPSSGITMSNVGDMYLNASTNNTYRCTVSGAAAVALWVYVSNIKGATGDTGAAGTNGTNGVGVVAGGTIRQALVKLSSTNYDTGWSDAVLQYSTMPTAAVGNLGQIAQFTGTTGTYTHGHIYECVSSGGGSPTYSWSEIVYGDPNSVSYSSQSKTTGEKTQARANIAAIGYEAQTLDASQKAQSLVNIGATPNDGWSSANESWAYASATTITVPSGAASKYAIGDKVKLTQTTVKYFYIIGVADTVLTVSGGATYTVANAAITLPFYSHAVSPVGFPWKFTLSSPTWTTSGTPFTNQPTTDVFTFSMSGKEVRLDMVAHMAATSGGTGRFIITAAPNQLPNSGGYSAGAISNNDAYVFGGCLIPFGPVVITAIKYDGSTLATSNQYVFMTLSYAV